MFEVFNLTFQRIKKEISNIDKIVALIIIINFIVYFILLIYSYYNFFSFNEGDKGIMYQMYYNTVVNGDFFYSSVLQGSGISFRYILTLFLPFMYLYPNPPIMLSLISTFLLSLGALPVYWLATDVAKSKRIGLLFVGLYFMYPAIGWFFLESVKEELFVLPFLLFAFYYMHVKSYLKFMVFLFLAVMCKQNIFLVLPMFGLYAYLDSFEKKWIVGPVVLSAAWFLTSIFLIKPYINSLSNIAYDNTASHEGVILSSNWADITSYMPSFSSLTASRYSWMGSNLSEILNNFVMNPLLFISHLGTSENIVYLILLFIPFCGISLLKPKVLMIGLPVFLQNLLANSTFMKMITWHYSSVLVFVIITSAILAFPCIYLRINDKQKKLFVFILIIVAAISFFSFGPFNEIVNNVHNTKSNNDKLDVTFGYLGITTDNKNLMHATLNDIPPHASIVASARFGPYLYKHNNVSYEDWRGITLNENYDYYLIWIRQETSDYPHFDMYQKILQRSDLTIKYYDGSYIVLGTDEKNSDLDMKDISKMGIFGFMTQPNVGYPYYDTTLGEKVFFSSKQTNSTGYLVYGPFMTLPPGEYTIDYMIKATNITQPENKIAEVDIMSTYIKQNRKTQIDVGKSIYGRDLVDENYTHIALNFVIDDNNYDRLLEFRVFQPLNSDLYVNSVNITKKVY